MLKKPKAAQIAVPKIPPMEQFQLISEYLGYVTKPDKTNIAAGYLVAGSQNMRTNNGDQLSSRMGYALLGAAATNANPIISSYEWITNRGIEHGLRRYSDTLQALYGTTWYTILTGLATTAVNLVHSNFAEFWDNTNKIDQLLFTDGSSNIYSWTGAVATFASATATTLTKQGSASWATTGVLLSGTRSIIINGVTATYTGGESTTTLSGVSVDFSATAVGTPVFQLPIATAVSTFTSTNVSIPSTYLVDLIKVLGNQVYLGSLSSREVYLSQANSYTNYSKSSPRVTGEGEKITLDACTVGMEVGDSSNSTNTQVMNISAGKSFWYVVLFNPSSDNTNEAVQIKRLKTQPSKGALSQSAMGNVVNDIFFISQEPTFDSLGRVEQINNTPQTSPLSDLIKPDFDAANFTNTHVKYFKNNVYITVPSDGKVLIRNLAKGYWEPPQIMPIRRFGIINGALIGHSSLSNESYTMDVGYNDNTNTISCIAALAYNANAAEGYVPTRQKSFSEHYTEGYMSTGTTVTLTLNFDYQGFTTIKQRSILGSNTSILFGITDDNSLGEDSLGTVSLGGGSSSDDPLVNLPKFRIINTFSAEDYYEYQPIYSSDGVDQVWSILKFGPAATLSTAAPVSIKD